MGLYIGRKVYPTTRTSFRSVLLNPKAHAGDEARNFSKFQSLYGESSKLFEVLGSLYGQKNIYDDSHYVSLGASNSHSHLFLHIICPLFPSYFIHFLTYFFIFLHNFHIFWHVSCLCGDLTLMAIFPPTFIFKSASPPPPLKSYLEKFWVSTYIFFFF